MDNKTRAEKIVRRFWEKVDTSGKCWIWNGSTNAQGYGQVRWDGMTMRAHRVSWFLKNGSIADSLFVLHRCDNPPCVKPEHLFLGDNAENMRDMYKKKRRLPGPGREPEMMCKRGHLKSPDNLYKRGLCKACVKIRQTERTRRAVAERIRSMTND